MAVHGDFRTCVAYAETEIKDVFDGLSVTAGINDELEEIDR